MNVAISESAFWVAGDLLRRSVGVAGLKAQDATQLGGVSWTSGVSGQGGDGDENGKRAHLLLIPS
jgi:hypothetical protein